MPGHIRSQRILHSFWNTMTHAYRDVRFGSVQFSCSCPTLLWPHELQHARPPCPSPTPRAYPNTCPLSRWCHPTISSSVIPFSSCPQSFPSSSSFQMSQLFTWDGQSTGVSASTSVLPMNTQDWSPLGWTGWISLQSKGLSRVFSKQRLMLLLTRQCFPCRLMYQVSLISLTNLLECFRGPLEKS